MTQLVDQHTHEDRQDGNQQHRRIRLVRTPDDEQSRDPEDRMHANRDPPDTETEIELSLGGATNHLDCLSRGGLDTTGESNDG